MIGYELIGVYVLILLSLVSISNFKINIDILMIFWEG